MDLQPLVFLVGFVFAYLKRFCFNPYSWVLSPLLLTYLSLLRLLTQVDPFHVLRTRRQAGRLADVGP